MISHMCKSITRKKFMEVEFLGQKRQTVYILTDITDTPLWTFWQRTLPYNLGNSTTSIDSSLASSPTFSSLNLFGNHIISWFPLAFPICSNTICISVECRFMTLLLFWVIGLVTFNKNSVYIKDISPLEYGTVFSSFCYPRTLIFLHLPYQKM